MPDLPVTHPGEDYAKFIESVFVPTVAESTRRGRSSGLPAKDDQLKGRRIFPDK